MDRPQQPPLLQLALLAAVITACSLAGWASAGRSLDHLQAPAGGAGLLAAVAIALLSLAWYRQNRQLRWRKAELRAQNLRLDAAVNNITQALLMFDAQARLILCNDRYREMYGLSEQDACAGTPLRTLLEHRARLGNFHGDPVQYCAEILADVTTGKTTGKTMELSDGRVIALINQPLAGGGWVCTHQDVTELKRREHELNVQNMRFVAALENMSHGLAMFDRERRLVICNERFVALYGLPPELSRPGTTLEQILQHRLASGSHVGEGQDFVQSRLAMVARGEHRATACCGCAMIVSSLSGTARCRTAAGCRRTRTSPIGGARRSASPISRDTTRSPGSPTGCCSASPWKARSPA